jgi:hypothetical protein
MISEAMRMTLLAPHALPGGAVASQRSDCYAYRLAPDEAKSSPAIVRSEFTTPHVDPPPLSLARLTLPILPDFALPAKRIGILWYSFYSFYSFWSFWRPCSVSASGGAPRC